MRFTGRVCRIMAAGPASGVQRASGAEGGRIVIVDRDEPRGRETTRAITAAGGTALFAKADVSVAADARR